MTGIIKCELRLEEARRSTNFSSDLFNVLDKILLAACIKYYLEKKNQNI